MKKPFIIAIIVVVLAAGISLWMLGSDAESATDRLEVSGMVEATTIDVAFEIAGKIAELPVEEGDVVQADQLIARLDGQTWKAKLNQAMAGAQSAAKTAAQAETRARVEASTTGPQIAQAEAAYDGASAQYDKARSGPRSQEIEAARQNVEQARAARDAARENLAKLRAGFRPQEIREARLAVEAADAAVEAARAALDKAQAGPRPQEIKSAEARLQQAESTARQAKSDLDRIRQMHDDGAVSDQRLDTAQTKYETASAEVAVAEQALQLLQEGTRAEDIRAAEAQLQQAKKHRERAKEALELLEEGYRAEDIGQAEQKVAQLDAAYAAAREQLEMLREGTRSEDIAAARAEKNRTGAAAELARRSAESVEALRRKTEAARAQEEAALAAAEEARVYLDKTTITAPCNAVVQDEVAEVGETVGAGAPIVRIINLDDVWVTVYVPETMIGRVSVGQSAAISIDTFPDKTFQGRVQRISSEAEFTPKYVQTPDERSRLVYAVKIALDNRDQIFKPGMPVDAVIQLSKTGTTTSSNDE
ncbi:MAG: HlyD family efflux transporter periplasmic adaptor subunit [Armatimonadota bacterium]